MSHRKAKQTKIKKINLHPEVKVKVAEAPFANELEAEISTE